MQLKVDDIIIHIRWKRLYRIKSIYTNLNGLGCFVAVDFSGFSHTVDSIHNFQQNFKIFRGKLTKHLYAKV